MLVQVWFVHEYFLFRLERGVRFMFDIMVFLFVCTLG